MKKSFLNLNINKEDRDLNDFICAWESFTTRPNKTSLLSSFDNSDFKVFLEKYSIVNISLHKEIFPLGEENLINRKIFAKYNDDVYLSYTEYDVEHDESLVNEVSIYHKEVESEDLVNLIEELTLISDKFDSEEQPKVLNTNILSFGTTGFELSKIEFPEIDLENFDLYYNDDTLSQVKKLQKQIKKNKKGLSVFYGERGTGKTSLVQSIVSNSNKNAVFIPSTLFETTINNPEFRTFLKSNTDSILILDDAELFFSEIYSKSNIFTNNILQLVDGLDSDNLKVHIFVVLNVKDIDEVDHILLDSNNLLDIIQINSLGTIKIKELSKHLNRKIKNKGDVKLIDVLRKRNSTETKSDIGFV